MRAAQLTRCSRHKCRVEVPVAGYVCKRHWRHAPTLCRAASRGLTLATVETLGQDGLVGNPTKVGAAEQTQLREAA